MLGHSTGLTSQNNNRKVFNASLVTDDVFSFRVMKNQFQRFLCFFVLYAMADLSRAQSNPPPVLKMVCFSNQLQISILNPAAGSVYQIQRRASLANATNWSQQMLGTPGQTNFTITPQPNSSQFFRVFL